MTTSRAKLRVAGSNVTPPEVARRREQAFQDWMLSAETAYLECRVGKHIIPGISDDRTSKEIIRGVCVIESSCIRCGTVLRKAINVKDGYLVGKGRANYDYSQADGYLLPREAIGPGGTAMDREHRGMVRLEVIDRAFRTRGTSLDKQVAADARRNQR